MFQLPGKRCGIVYRFLHALFGPTLSSPNKHKVGLHSGSEPGLSDGRAGKKAASDATWSRPRERADMRAAILEAAERLMLRDGIDAVTLSAVAGEAKIARAVIYSHFSSRKELLSQVQQAPAEEVAPDAPPAEPAGESKPAAPPDGAYENLMRVQAEALDHLAKRVMVPKLPRRDGTDATLVRLDTRLGVVEQAFTALERRMDEKLKALGGETEGMAATLQDIRRQLEKFEERQQGALAQLRQDVFYPSHADKERAKPEPAAVEVVFPVVLPDAEQIPEPSYGLSPGPEYLRSARRAAIDAAQLAAAEPTHAPRFKLRLGWKRMTLLGIAALLVVWFDIYVYAHYQPAEGGFVRPQVQAVVVKRPVKPFVAPSPRAQLIRGLRYLNGTGVAIDVTKAALWIGRAASSGQPVAQNYLGVLYQTGTGVDADIPAAIGFYEAAARQGNLKAMTNLGKLYAGGWAEGTDFVKAAEWFGRAAAFGEGDAQFDLAILTERGEGVSRNIAEAYKWYAVAGAAGDAHASARAEILAAQLLPGDLAAAKKAAADFKPLPPDPAANAVPTAE
jgi:TPR repeat protein